jgi:hypothetical protein
MIRDGEWPDRMVLILVAAAWVGIWGAWIPNPAVALTENALDLAEWATYLNDVRYGGLRLMPELLRLGVSLAVVSLAVAAGTIDYWSLRWGIRLVAVIPGLVMLPPYPFVLSPIGSGYEWRMVTSLVLWIGAGLTFFIDQLGWRSQRRLVVVLSGLAAVGSWWAYLALRAPFEAHYNHAVRPGWGLIVFGLGLLTAAGLAIYELLVAQRD